MRLAVLIAFALTLSACGKRPFWDGDVYVIDRRAPDRHTCTVSGTLQSWYPESTVFGRDGLPVKCRWMTDEERDR